MLEVHPRAVLPWRSTVEAAGLDIYSLTADIVPAQSTLVVATGIKSFYTL